MGVKGIFDIKRHFPKVIGMTFAVKMVIIQHILIHQGMEYFIIVFLAAMVGIQITDFGETNIIMDRENGEIHS